MWNDKVKEIMTNKGINQKQLSIKSGITESSISRYLASGKSPRYDILYNIARALEVSIDDIVDDKASDDSLFDRIQSTVLLAREGENLTPEEKNKLINLILNYDDTRRKR